MRVVMVGTGYVGLVSGACFADFGHSVTCVDKDPKKIKTLNAGGVPIYEPGLEELIANNVKSGRLAFTTDLANAVQNADAVFIAVGTPSRRGDGHADLSYVHAATKEIAAQIKDFTVVITKSTVPVGTGDEVENILSQICPKERFAVVSNPEFLREGAAIEDFKRPDRIIVGTDSEPAREVMKALYRPLYLNETPMVFTTRRTSELIKYAGNAFLATKITFINEMADLCETLGTNVQEVARGIGLDNRIGAKFLNAGPGYGGSCFPKDTVALQKTASDAGVDLSIVSSVIEANTARKRTMATKIISACGGEVKDKKIAILGLSFKPNTDDIRAAPSLTIIPHLQGAGAKISAYDPKAMMEARQHFSDLTYHDDPYATVENADAMVILTEWDQFRALDLDRIKSLMRGTTIIDLRNIYIPAEMRSHGFTYTSIGRPDI